MSQDREPDRDHDGGHEKILVWQATLLDQDHCEDDRREPSRAEPAEEADSRAARSCPEHCHSDRQHAGDGEAQDGVQCDRPRDCPKCRAEHDGSEDEERGRAEDATELLDQVADLASVTTSQTPEDHSPGECRDEAGATHRVGEAVGEHGGREGHYLKP